MIDLNKLKDRVREDVLVQLQETLLKYKMTDPLEVSHFLAQTAHESSGFTQTTENLKYSAVRLLQVFPKYFNGENVENYSGNPVSIASRVYANRMGNGDEKSLDGWMYRGRGYIQLTGRNNYQSFDRTVDDDVLNRPDLIATKYPMLSAGWFWTSRGLKGAAEQGSGPSTVEAVTKIINGGRIGLDDRIKRFEFFYGLLKDG